MVPWHRRSQTFSMYFCMLRLPKCSPEAVYTFASIQGPLKRCVLAEICLEQREIHQLGRVVYFNKGWRAQGTQRQVRGAQVDELKQEVAAAVQGWGGGALSAEAFLAEMGRLGVEVQCAPAQLPALPAAELLARDDLQLAYDPSWTSKARSWIASLDAVFLDLQMPVYCKAHAEGLVTLM